MLTVMISIFYLPIRYCSLELQKIIVRFSRENVRMHPVFKEFRLIVNSWIHNNAKRIDFNLSFTYSLLFFRAAKNYCLILAMKMY